MTGPESTIVRFSPWNGPPRRIVYEPAVDGYRRREEVYNSEGWHTVGTELVEDVAIEGAENIA